MVLIVSVTGGAVKVSSAGCEVADLCAVNRLDDDGQAVAETLVAVVEALKGLDLDQ